MRGCMFDVAKIERKGIYQMTARELSQQIGKRHDISMLAYIHGFIVMEVYREENLIGFYGRVENSIFLINSRHYFEIEEVALPLGKSYKIKNVGEFEKYTFIVDVLGEYTIIYPPSKLDLCQAPADMYRFFVFDPKSIFDKPKTDEAECTRQANLI